MMAAIIRYVALLAAVTHVAVASPTGNNGCAKFCQDSYAHCGFKNVGQCSSNAAQNGNTCSCCPNGGEWCSAKTACVAPGKCTTSSKTTQTSTKNTATSTKNTATSTKNTATSTKNTATSTKNTAAPTSTNNGQQFQNKCTNTGISIADCAQLANIAALNGNSINVGGSGSGSGTTPVNNGQQFLNYCTNTGVSVLDCSQLLNVAILNGNSILISLADLTALIAQLGLSLGSLLGTILSLPTTSSGLIILPASILA